MASFTTSMGATSISPSLSFVSSPSSVCQQVNLHSCRIQQSGRRSVKIEGTILIKWSKLIEGVMNQEESPLTFSLSTHKLVHIEWGSYDGTILIKWSKLIEGVTDREAAQSSSPPKRTSILCQKCNGNGAIVCTQCKGDGVNAQDFFNGQFKAGATCWLCRGKREMLCGECNGAGFMGGFLSSSDDI